jgi:fatty-acyl-CoA synthase
MKIGAVVELLNTRLTASELVHPIIDAGAKAIVTEPALVDLLALAAARNERLRIIVTRDVDGCESLTKLRRAGERPPATWIASTDPALICYTSGTTGLPKGAILSHGAIRMGGMVNALARPMSSQDKVLLAMPLAFAGGTATTYLGYAVMSGATIVIAPDADAETMLRLIESERITAWPCVTTICKMVIEHPKAVTTDLSSLRFAVCGGSPVSRDLLQAWQARGVALTQGYGSTETSGQHGSLLFGEDAARKLGTAGRPMMHASMRVVDAEDRDVPVGTPGELLFKGPTLFSGYLNLPEQTAQSMRDGWFHTGDMAQFDDEGFITIVDRLKDMIISGGLNVYPAEIERVLSQRAGLDQFAVIGVADERWGEVPMVVIRNLDAVDVHSLRDICIRELADYKRPRYVVEHRAELPTTMSGKVLKRPLRELYSVVPAGAVDLKSLSRRDA